MSGILSFFLLAYRFLSWQTNERVHFFLSTFAKYQIVDIIPYSAALLSTSSFFLLFHEDEKLITAITCCLINVTLFIVIIYKELLSNIFTRVAELAAYIADDGISVAKLMRIFKNCIKSFGKGVLGTCKSLGILPSLPEKK